MTGGGPVFELLSHPTILNRAAFGFFPISVSQLDNTRGDGMKWPGDSCLCYNGRYCEQVSFFLVAVYGRIIYENEIRFQFFPT